MSVTIVAMVNGTALASADTNSTSILDPNDSCPASDDQIVTDEKVSLLSQSLLEETVIESLIVRCICVVGVNAGAARKW